MEAKFYLTDNRLRVLITALPKAMEVMHNLVCKLVSIFLVGSQDCSLSTWRNEEGKSCNSVHKGLMHLTHVSSGDEFSVYTLMFRFRMYWRLCIWGASWTDLSKNQWQEPQTCSFTHQEYFLSCRLLWAG